MRCSSLLIFTEMPPLLEPSESQLHAFKTQVLNDTFQLSDISGEADFIRLVQSCILLICAWQLSGFCDLAGIGIW